MYFVDKIKELSKDNKCSIFVDMDGVIADFEFFKSLDFKNKRPIITNINTFKEISTLENIDLYILSICKKDEQVSHKNDWLDKYAPFFKKHNRIIISKESHPNLSSKQLKELFLNDYINKLKNDLIIVIDDDNEILLYLSIKLKNIIYFQDSSIID